MPKENSYRDRRLDRRMRIVAEKLEVLVLEREEIFHFRIDRHRRERPLFTRELKLRLLDVIRVQVRIAERVDEFARS